MSPTRSSSASDPPQAGSEEIVVRRPHVTEIERAASLAVCLVDLHHMADPGRFFRPENVQRGYAWWFGKELERSAAVLLVALRGEEMLGYAYGALEERDWNLLLDTHGAIHDVFVVEAARRQGVGRRLMDAMIRELEALGAPRIVLSTMVRNESAQRLFAAVGFRPTMLEMTRGG
jgi:ribosomal protein S18 acetylase RimI-like enzyme